MYFLFCLALNCNCDIFLPVSHDGDVKTVRGGKVNKTFGLSEKSDHYNCKCLFCTCDGFTRCHSCTNIESNYPVHDITNGKDCPQYQDFPEKKFIRVTL